MLDHEGKEVPGNRGYKYAFLFCMLSKLVYKFS